MSNEIQAGLEETVSLNEAEELAESTITSLPLEPFAQRGVSDADDPAQLIGKVFAHKYEIQAPLGRGGMSIVYRARHTAMDKVFALKILQMHLSTDAISLRRFKQEAQTASNLNHPGIVCVHDFGEDGNGMPYLVMDYVEGSSLSDLIKKGGRLSCERFLELMQQVSSALTHAHENGIVHRDLKPSNIIVSNVDGKETARILDFGIAKILSQSDEAQQLTQTGEVFGSPLYMSPEQCSGSAIDQRSDIYSMGCVMYEALSGKVPHMGDSIIETIHKHVNDSPPPLVAPQIDEGERQKIEVILLKCLAKKPEDRFQSMRELEAELRSLSLKSKRGILGKLGGAWDLAAAKRRASKKSKLTLMASVLLTISILSAFSGMMLMVRFHEMESAISRLQKCRQLLRLFNQEQQSVLDMQEAGAQFARASYWRGVSDKEKRRLEKIFDDTSEVFNQRLSDVEKMISEYPDFNKDYYRKWRPAMILVSNTYAEFAKSFQHRPMIESQTSMDMRSIIAFRRMTAIVAENMHTIHQMNRRGEQLEEKILGEVNDTTQWVVYLGVLSVILSGSAAVSLIYYFAKGTPQKMRKLAEEAMRLRKKGKLTDTGADVVEDIDNVLHELASALSEAEEREKILLSRLQGQEKRLERKPESEKPPVNLADSTRISD